MKSERAEALATLRSVDLFAHLRGTLRRAGLAGEEKYGVGIYFVATSRILRNPLRLYVGEKTEGSANYVVRKVSKLLRPESFVEISSEREQAWGRFAKNPEHRVVYLPTQYGSSSVRSDAHIEVLESGLTRLMPVERNERVEEDSEEVEAQFACISAEYRPEREDASRWLTMTLGKPPKQARPKFIPLIDAPMALDGKDLAVWHHVQDLVEERARMPIVLPEWADLVVEAVCKDEFASPHLPAFLQSWKTMSVLRSFLSDEKKLLQRGQLEADFASFAAAGLLLRGVCWEGRRFPSTRNTFEKVHRKGEVDGLIHPLSGKGIRYQWRQESLVR